MKINLIEPYDPLETFPLKIDENQLGGTFIVVSLMTLAIIVGSLISIPESLPGLAFLILSLMVMSFAADAHGWAVMHPIRKKCAQKLYTTDYMHPWYSREVAEQNPLYKEKLMEYLDYCRAGGEPNKIVQRHLSEWLADAKSDIKNREQNKEQTAAEMFINLDQLEAYRKALSDVEKLNR